MTALLEVRDLAKHFPIRGGLFRRTTGWLKAVDGVSFDLAPGETLGVVGESGCGKSTLGRSLLRLIEPTAGSVRLEGEELTTADPRRLRALRARMQMIFQDPYGSLPPRRRVGDILREPMDVHAIGPPGARRDRVVELLETVGLDARALERYAHQFSGGQRQRIAIARALAVRPRLVVADEPVSALDVSVQSQVLNLLAEIQQRFGVAFVFISHDLAVVQHVSRRVGVMYLGRLVELGPADKVFAQPAHPYTRALMEAVPVPDPARRSNRLRLAGEPPSPADPPPGCAFHTRCPRAVPICRRIEPRELNLGWEEEPHLVRCHLNDPKVETP